MPQPQARQRQKPQHADRAEQLGHAGRAMALHDEQPDQNPQRHRQHIGRQRRHDQPQTLDRRQHRNRRRDGGVPGKKCRPRQRQQQDRDRPLASRQPHQRVQRQNAALTPVVGAQKEEHILDRHDQDQRPDQQRQDAQHLRRRRSRRASGPQRLAKGIDRRRADIAIDHPDRAQGQDRDALTDGLVGVDVLAGVLLGLQIIGNIQRLFVKQRQRRLAGTRSRVVNHQITLGWNPARIAGMMVGGGGVSQVRRWQTAMPQSDGPGPPWQEGCALAPMPMPSRPRRRPVNTPISVP